MHEFEGYNLQVLNPSFPLVQFVAGVIGNTVGGDEGVYLSLFAFTTLLHLYTS